VNTVYSDKTELTMMCFYVFYIVSNVLNYVILASKIQNKTVTRMIANCGI